MSTAANRDGVEPAARSATTTTNMTSNRGSHDADLAPLTAAAAEPSDDFLVSHGQVPEAITYRAADAIDNPADALTFDEETELKRGGGVDANAKDKLGLAEEGAATSYLMSSEDSDIYDMIDAVVSRSDDTTLPVLTFRVVLLGGFFGLAMCAANVLFSFRTNSFSTNSFIGVLLSYPIGKFMERVLPRGVLNPGPFNYKEHTLIYVICSCMASPAYALYNIVGQKYQLYQENLTDVAAVFFVINTQIVGYGLAGLCRRFLVRPPAMLWPPVLSVVAMLRTLHETKTASPSDTPSTNPVPASDSRFLKISRYSFFWCVAFACAAYQIIPVYVAPILTAVSLLCFISPQSASLPRLLGSAYQGFGVLSLSFDWNVIGSTGPITTPLWALFNQIFGMWLMAWIVTPILWKSNAFGIDSQLGTLPAMGPNGSGDFPLGYAMNTPALFDRNGQRINPRELVVRPSLVLNETKYDEHKPIYITTLFAVEYLASFIVFIAALVHVGLWYSKDILSRLRTAMRELDSNDIHARLMDFYPDVPDWWYIAVLAVNAVASIVVCQFGGFDLPWWGVLLGLALAVVSILPIGVILAISGQAIGLNVMSEFLIGLILPGRTAAVMAFKTLSYMAMNQGLSLVGDLKLGHYMKIPPRAMFMAQLVSTVVAAIVNVFVAKGVYESFGKTCVTSADGTTNCNIWKLQTKDAPLGWTSTGYNVFLNAGAIWGAIGPARFFGPGSPYQWTLIGFAIGAVMPIIPWLLHKRFPNGYWHLVNIPLIAVFPTEVGSTRSNMITPLLVGLFFNYFLRRRHHAWWQRYNYVTAAALDSGLAICVTVIFFCFTLGIGARNASEANRIFPYWALNPYDGEYCAPSWYITCSENANWGNAWGKSYFMINEQDPYCTSINFQGMAAEERQRAIDAGVISG
ncbi:hypothetical protein HDU96_001201 [Phlyctochytrium bullatum]|nr:hypothetical protein HDU96_001201 [Phlyctochytrium bullatum]